MRDTTHLNERYALILGSSLGYAPKDDKFSSTQAVPINVLPTVSAEDKTAEQHYADHSTPTSLNKYYGYIVGLGMNYIPGLAGTAIKGEPSEDEDLEEVSTSIWTMDPALWENSVYKSFVTASAFTDPMIKDYTYTGNDLTITLDGVGVGGAVALINPQDLIDGFTLSIGMSDGGAESIELNSSNIAEFIPYSAAYGDQWAIFGVCEQYIHNGEIQGNTPTYTLTFKDGRKHVLTYNTGVVYD